ncbi:MAG: transglutaminase-like domain-containing protein [Candidatus Micrarchaeota archaeon]
MKAALLLLLLLPFAHPASFGYSRLIVERSWDVESGAPYEFSGALVVNDSNQRVVSITTEPQMDVFTDENGTVRLGYNGNGSASLRAIAIVDVDYDTQISSDPALPRKGIPGTNLTAADEDISFQARRLAREESALLTVRDLVNWVHDNVEYDISYWGKVKSAREVYAERRGVCVEYAHLLISMARSLGFQTRYVSGYVMGASWQPHAWAEILVPGYGWLPADATFGQVGILDTSHVAIQKGDDQSQAYDLLLSRDKDANISATDSVSVSFDDADPKGVAVALDVDIDTYVAETTIDNSRDEYVFGSYSLLAPEGFGGQEPSVVLLRPSEKLRLYRGLNYSLFEEGFLYDVPVTASFNDAVDGETVKPGLERLEGGRAPQGLCIPASLLVILIALIALAGRKI